MNMNPFFSNYNTPHGTVPFHLIKLEHFEPAIREGIKQQQAEIEAITAQTEAPTFENTIEAFERSGRLLERATTVFENLMSAETNDEMQELAKTLMPLLSEHANNISLNEALFHRVKAVYDQREALDLSTEQCKLLEDTYVGFARNGANLEGKDKETYRSLTNQLSLLTLQFSENLLKETNDYQLHITEADQLAGLPESSKAAALEAAHEKGLDGWVFTLHAPSYMPFMMYAEKRELRKELYMAYNTKCTHENSANNFEIVRQLVNLRLQLAQLLGYQTYADYKLERRMAENATNVYQLLDDLLEAYTPTALKEVEAVKAIAKELDGADFELMPWDWSYYSHKLKERIFQFDSEQLRPYFELSNVIKGVFGLATRLYGITFKENKEIPVYHPDVKA